MYKQFVPSATNFLLSFVVLLPFRDKYGLKSRLERHRLRLPNDGKRLSLSLHNIVSELTPVSFMRFQIKIIF